MAPPAQRLRLRDGRWLGYAEYGDPRGRPVIVCHGTPGCRLDRPPDDHLAADAGARLIIPDRPGFGASTYQPGRRLLDWPADVARLADSLGIERFALLGFSGGGPYAAACAHQLTSRLTRVALVSSLAEPTVPDALTGMAANNLQALAAQRRVPGFALRWLYALQVRSQLRHPERALDQLAQQFAAPDQPLLAQPAIRALLIADVTEALRPGARGYWWEDRLLLLLPWGFALGEISAEVHLWHGEHDTLAPIGMGRYLASAIPGCRARFLPGEGHLSTYYAHWREILATLLAEPPGMAPG